MDEFVTLCIAAISFKSSLSFSDFISITRSVRLFASEHDFVVKFEQYSLQMEVTFSSKSYPSPLTKRIFAAFATGTFSKTISATVTINESANAISA